MSEAHEEAPHDAAPTETSVQCPTPDPAPQALEEPRAAAFPPKGADAAPPAPSAPGAPGAVKKPLEQWAREKGCYIDLTGERNAHGLPKNPSSPGDEKHFYAGALAKWRWVPTMEVTEAEFDAEIFRVKHGVVVGQWPHPPSVAKAVEARLAETKAREEAAREAAKSEAR